MIDPRFSRTRAVTMAAAVALATLAGTLRQARGQSESSGQDSPRPAPAVLDQEQLQRLVDQIARGDEVEAAAATEELVERLVRPVADALGALESRPAAEQRRLRGLLSRLSAALRLKLYRAELSEVERKLLDEFVRQHPDLSHQLFDPNFLVRQASLARIPLEPNSGAGLMIAARVNDEDEQVAAAALEVALKLHDPVVARRLTLYVQGATEAIRSGYYSASEQEIALTVAQFVARSIHVLGEAQDAEAVPTIIDALEYFGRSPYWIDRTAVTDSMNALGQIGDERAAQVLLGFLNDTEVIRFRAAPDGRRATSTVGDVALWNLCRIFKVPPESLGLVVLKDFGVFVGFADEAQRVAARTAFLTWHRENAGKPASERGAPTTQPAKSGDDGSRRPAP